MTRRHERDAAKGMAMATLSAFSPMDMLDYHVLIKEPSMVSSRLLFLELPRNNFWYSYGDFKYADDQIKGDIKRIEHYDGDGDLGYLIHGLDVNATHLKVGMSVGFAIRSGFNGADRIAGSAGSDRLAGFSGDDTIRGQSGDDRLFGNDDNDTLYGGQGDDVLLGGLGNDILTGGSGADRFIFNGDANRDVITDFAAGRDTIRITSGADQMRDLTIRADGDDTRLVFAQTKILLEDVRPSDLEANDFIFG